MAINKAIIQIRRGLKDDLQIDKLLPGELAIATDAPCMWFCWSVGNVEQVPTSDNLSEVVADVLKKYLEENPVVGISEIYMRVYDGYIQYSSDNQNWENVISIEELKGEKGDPGEKGDAGVGIIEITQETGSLDGGENKISIHLSDGSVKTISIYNGATGEPGPAGSDASVTAENIKSALGYTPANSEKLDRIFEDVLTEVETVLSSGTNKTLTLGIDYKAGDTLKFECLTDNTGVAEISYEIYMEPSEPDEDDDLIEEAGMGFVTIAPMTGSEKSYTKMTVNSTMLSFSVNGYVTAYRIDYKNASGSETGDDGTDNSAVKYEPQELTDDQKAQARTNIGAASEADKITISYDAENKIVRFLSGGVTLLELPAEKVGEYYKLLTDITLTAAGVPADAAAVGERLGELSQEIVDLTSRIEVVENSEAKDVLAEVGYQENMRIASSGVILETNANGSDATNYIPCKTGDVIYLEDMDVPSAWTSGAYWNYVSAYDANKTHIKQEGLYMDAALPGQFGFAVDAVAKNGKVVRFTVKESVFGANVAYIAISAKDITADSKIYINVAPANDEDAESEIPEYWASELETKADEIQRAMEAAGRNKSAFLWYTDAHWQTNSGKSPALLEYLVNNTPMNKVNFGGDIINDPSAFTHENIKYAYEWRNDIANLPNHHSVYGNHDLNHWTTDVSNIAYALMLAPEESAEMVVGGDSYYYIDNTAEKTRYLYLSYLTSDHNAMTAQGEFIVDALLGVNEGWHIVAIAHRWFQYTSSSAPTVGSVPAYETEILKIFDEYNARTTHTASNYFTTQDFASGKGKVEFCIGGHIHVDYDFKTDGGIPVIITASDTNQERSADETEDSGTLGTTTESAVFGVIANYTTNEITVIGVGRGTSRVIADEQPKVNVLEEVGYTDDRRINSSGGIVEWTSSDADVTGYIPVKIGDIIQIENMPIPSAYTSGVYWNGVGAYTSSKTFIKKLNLVATSTAQAPAIEQIEKDGNIVQFTITTEFGSNVAYIVINAKDITADSKVYVISA